MANYTKGPWHYYPWLSQFRIDVKGTLEPVCYNIPKEANAQLIAAAPELYEALRDIREIIFAYAETLPKIPQLAIKVKCDAALAKAEGRE